MPPHRRIHIVSEQLWLVDAACRGTDPNFFFPDESDLIGIANAKAVCGRCAVATSCLLEALANNEHGVWGGSTDAERRRIKRESGARADL